MKDIIFTNETTYPTKKLVRLINFCTPPWLTKGFKIKIEQSNESGDWDGTCFPDDREIEILCPPESDFPQVFDINHDFPEAYLRQIYFASINEFLIHFISHELLHIFISDNPKLFLFHPGFIDFTEWDEESAADLFGLLNLGRYRRGQTNY